MRPTSALTKLSPLLKAPSFTSADALARGVTASTLIYYANQGAIQRIGRGIYRGLDSPTVDLRWADLIEAVQRTHGGVVCLTSALALYELTDEIPRKYWIAIHNTTTHRGSKHTRIMRLRNMTLGASKIKLGEIEISIFDRERTIIDSFRHLSREVAIKALKSALATRGVNRVDTKKLTAYGKKLRFDIEPYILALTT
jgi:predicted transcriptional regulator of viral defense system